MSSQPPRIDLKKHLHGSSVTQGQPLEASATTEPPIVTQSLAEAVKKPYVSLADKLKGVAIAHLQEMGTIEIHKHNLKISFPILSNEELSAKMHNDAVVAAGVLMPPEIRGVKFSEDVVDGKRVMVFAPPLNRAEGDYDMAREAIESTSALLAQKAMWVAR